MLRRAILLKSLILGILLALSGVLWEAYAYDTKSDRQNSVRVDVRPIQFVQGKPAKFQVRMSTHSVNLSQDMAAVSICKDDQGREYRPVSWQGSPPGGHHRSGVLEFPVLEGNPNKVTLVIKNIANVPERVFVWEVEP